MTTYAFSLYMKLGHDSIYRALGSDGSVRLVCLSENDEWAPPGAPELGFGSQELELSDYEYPNVPLPEDLVESFTSWHIADTFRAESLEQLDTMHSWVEAEFA